MVDERELQKYKVAELKQMLHDYGMPPKGLKADLVRQLFEVLSAREQQQQQQQQMVMQQPLASQQSMEADLEMHNPLTGTLPPDAETVNDHGEQLHQQQLHQEQQLQEPEYLIQQQQPSSPAVMVNGSTLPTDTKPVVVVVSEEDEDEEEEGDASMPLLSEEELAKMSKNQRRKYKKKLRNKQKRKERDLVEKKKQELAKLLLANQLKSLEEKKDMKREVVEDEDDAMEIDDEDEAEEEKEKKRRLEEEKQREEAFKKEDEMKSSLPEKIEIEYVPEAIPKDPVYMQFLKVFDKFSAVSPDEANRLEAERLAELHRNRDDRTKMLEMKKPIELELKDDDDGANADGSAKLSKRKLKALTRMSIADLKQSVTHPELVEMHDVTARDPILLLHLKSTRNTVPVPRHWCYKRKYLQGKRGFEKPPFKLPEFIRRTGIQEMREAVQEKEDAKSLKSKMREKIRPKMGKIDIDYQKLHDAFFKWQTKPNLTMHGDLYYESKELETRLKDKKPGDLTTELRSALGMPTGPNASKCPPPWLIAMQRYGPPPSYPNLKIPGLNAPIPEGCSFGYHAGGWGKPPVDEYGRPLYGDVFGITASANDLALIEEEVDRSKWGEPESEEESEAEEEEEDGDEEEDEEVDRSGLVTPAAEGLMTPTGFSTAQGIETPDMIELRKRKQAIEAEMESGENHALYTVIPEKKTDRFGKEMMGSMHVYDFTSLSKTSSKPSSSRHDGVEVALDPSELEEGALDNNQMAAKYEQSLRQQSGGNPHEDLSDMVAEYAASKQQQHKRRKGDQDGSKSSASRDKAKKYQFKF